MVSKNEGGFVEGVRVLPPPAEAATPAVPQLLDDRTTAIRQRRFEGVYPHYIDAVEALRDIFVTEGFPKDVTAERQPNVRSEIVRTEDGVWTLSVLFTFTAVSDGLAGLEPMGG